MEELLTSLSLQDLFFFSPSLFCSSSSLNEVDCQSLVAFLLLFFFFALFLPSGRLHMCLLSCSHCNPNRGKRTGMLRWPVSAWPTAERKGMTNILPNDLSACLDQCTAGDNSSATPQSCTEGLDIFAVSYLETFQHSYAHNFHLWVWLLKGHSVRFHEFMDALFSYRARRFNSQWKYEEMSRAMSWVFCYDIGRALRCTHTHTKLIAMNSFYIFFRPLRAEEKIILSHTVN